MIGGPSAYLRGNAGGTYTYSGGPHSGGYSGGYGQEDLRMPKRGMREHFKRTVLPRHQARKKKPTKPNSQTNSSKAQSNNPNFANDRNELLSQDDYIYKKFMTKSSREDQKSTPNNTNGTKGKIKEKRIMKNH